MCRDDKDFAIEFGEYLAKAAERFRDVVNDGYHNQDVVNDTWNALNSAIYEFRKRVAKVTRTRDENA